MICIILTLLIVFIFAFLMLTLPEQIARTFTRDDQTVEIIKDLLPWLSMFVMLDAVHGV